MKYLIVVLVVVTAQRAFRAIERRWSWVWLCRFAFRGAYKSTVAPVGLPGNRDPEHMCRYYSPVSRPDGTGSCETDGHYLCRECDHISSDALKERGVVQIEASHA